MVLALATVFVALVGFLRACHGKKCLNKLRRDFELDSRRFLAGFQGLGQAGRNSALPVGVGALPGEAVQFAEAAGIARDNIVWQEVEQVKGVYNFSSYDRILAQYDALGRRSPRLMITLAYGNPLYPDAVDPSTSAARKAFADFALACVQRYCGRGIFWEIWNEPNGFWGPAPNATLYALLSNAVGEAVENAGLSSEILTGPGTAMWWSYDVDYEYIEECFKLGTLRYWDAVNVHLYRATNPETVIDSFQRLNHLIQRYASSAQKHIPFISGEWGYSTCTSPCSPYPYTGNVDEVLQAKYLARQWLVNRMMGVVVSVWCSFFDLGPDSTQMGHRLGVVGNTYHNESLPHIPKPAYFAATTAQRFLQNAIFQGRINATFASEVQNHSVGKVPVNHGHSVANLDGVSIMGYSRTFPHGGSDGLYVLKFVAEGSRSEKHPQLMAASTRVVYAVWSLAGPSDVVFKAAGARAGACFKVAKLLGEPAPVPALPRRQRTCPDEEGGMLHVRGASDSVLYVYELTNAEDEDDKDNVKHHLTLVI